MSPTSHEPTNRDIATEENASGTARDGAGASDQESIPREQESIPSVQEPITDAGMSEQEWAEAWSKMTPAQREKVRARAEEMVYRAQNQAIRAKARTLPNMIWALLACFVVVAFLMIVTWRPKEEKVNAVPYSAQLEDAKKVASWVRGPAPMPSGWTATSAEFRAPEQRPMTWHLGIITSDKKYVGLEQSNVTGPSYQSDELGKTSDDGTATVAGVVWQRKTLLDRKDEHALVLVGSGVTTIVTGNAGYPALEQFAATLR